MKDKEIDKIILMALLGWLGFSIVMSIKTSVVFQTLSTGKSGPQAVNNFWEISAVITFVSSLLFLKLKTPFLYKKLKLIISSSPEKLKGGSLDIEVVEIEKIVTNGILSTVKTENEIEKTIYDGLSDSEKYEEQRIQQLESEKIARDYDEKEAELRKDDEEEKDLPQKEESSFPWVDEFLKLEEDVEKAKEKIKNHPNVSPEAKQRALKRLKSDHYRKDDRG